MAAIEWRSKNTIKGSFDKLVNTFVFPDASHEVKKQGNGRYTRVSELNSQRIKPILDQLGFKEKIIIVEVIKIIGNKLEITITSPDNISKYIEFVETRTFEKKGSNVNIRMNLSGTSYMNFVLQEALRQIYTGNRVPEIEALIASTVEDYHDIPQ
jgi:hypothetical protein